MGIEEAKILFYTSNLTIGVASIFLPNIYSSIAKVKNGSFDNYLLYPRSIKKQVLLNNININAIVPIITYLCLIFTSSLDIFLIIKIMICVVLGSLLILEINFLCFTFVLSLDIRQSILDFINNFYEFSNYPVEIFPKKIINFIIYIIPFYFVTYYPLKNILILKTPFSIIFMEVLGVIFILSRVSKLTLNYGIKNYRSYSN